MAVNTPLINGQMYSGATTIITLLGPAPIIGGLSKIDYERTDDIAFHNTIGSQAPTGYTEGQSKYSGSMTITKELHIAMEKANNGNTVAFPLFDIGVSFIKNGADAVTKTLKNVKIVSEKTGVDTSNNAIMVDLSFLYSGEI